MPVTFINSGRFTTGAFDPLSLTPTLYYDYSDAASITIVTGISQINDLSGNTIHAVQATTGNQPAYTTAAKNGLNVGTFDGTDSLVATSVTKTQPTMAFIVAKLSVATGAAQWLMSGPSGTSHVIYKLATTNFWSLYSGSVLSSVVAADTNWHVFCAVFNGASSYLMLDGVQIASGNAGTNGLSAVSVGFGAGPTGTSPMNGQMGFAAFGPVQTNSDRDRMIAHLKSKWAIT